MPVLIDAIDIVDTVHTLTGSGRYAGAPTSSFSSGNVTSPVLSYDEDFNTCWSYYARAEYRWVKALAIAQHEFSATLYISQIKVKAYVQSNRQIYWGGFRTPNFVRIYLKQSGVWNLLFNDERSAINWQVDYDDSSGWLCSGIKVEVESSSEGHDDDDAYCQAQIYEVQALYTPYSASGIQVKTGAGIISIGIEVLSGHKVRISAPDGITYGIPLLATNDPDASPVRVWDGSAVKALPKV
jgi:hypothetical protein